MDFMNKITIIIPTYNRYDKLCRLLKYYKSFNSSLRIKILDSSINKNNNKQLLELINNDKIEYFAFYFCKKTRIFC